MQTPLNNYVFDIFILNSPEQILTIQFKKVTHCRILNIYMAMMILSSWLCVILTNDDISIVSAYCRAQD